MTTTAEHQQVKFTDDDVVNKDDYIPTGGFRTGERVTTPYGCGRVVGYGRDDNGEWIKVDLDNGPVGKFDLKDIERANRRAHDRVVFTATADWWQIRGGDFTLADAWQGADCERAADVAGIDTDDSEAWVCLIEEVDEEHTAIRAGDYACCQGIGDDVVFVRLEG